jgi:BolA family transcriptional regulator, general stress-responsive regulator
VTTRKEQIAALLVDRLEPVELRIKDQSHLHAGHAGASDGRSHFDVYIVAGSFSGKSLLQRHRMIYGVLAEMLTSDIHALKISALAPDEV